MISIIKKDLQAYFGGWSAWMIIAAYSLISALFLFFFENQFNIFEIGSATLQPYFVLSPWLMMFLVPTLTMKSFAEEEQNGTLFWLFAQPINTFQLVLSKFWSAYIVGLLCLLPSLVYLYTVYQLGIPEGNLDWGMTLGGYLGLMMLAATFTAIGILASSLSKHQISAYLIGVFANFILYFGIEQLASYKLLGGVDYWLQNSGFYYHFMGFTRGLIDSRDVCYFLFIIGLSLGFAYVFINKKKSV